MIIAISIKSSCVSFELITNIKRPVRTTGSNMLKSDMKITERDDAWIKREIGLSNREVFSCPLKCSLCFFEASQRWCTDKQWKLSTHRFSGIILGPREGSFAPLYIKTASSAWSPFCSIRINAASASWSFLFDAHDCLTDNAYIRVSIRDPR